jgi:hypothetical protein
MISPTQISLPDNTQQSKGTDIFASGGTRNSNRNQPAAADPHPMPRGHLEARTLITIKQKNNNNIAVFTMYRCPNIK